MRNINKLIYRALLLLAAFCTIAVQAASLKQECVEMQPSWIWCDDFEQDRSAAYFEGAVNRVIDIGVSDSTAAAFQYTAGSSHAGGFKLAFGRTPNNYMRPIDAGTNNYREIYWRMYVMHPENWQGNGADKLTRATILSNDNWAQAMVANVWSGTDPGSFSDRLYMDPASGTDSAGQLTATIYNDFSNYRWLGSKYSEYPIFANQNFGKWHCVEVHVKLNDAGASNGIFQIKINGNVEAESDNLNWVGNYDQYGINAIFFENYWNSGSPVDQARYFDNIIVSSAPIGCGSSISPPKPPGMLNTTLVN